MRPLRRPAFRKPGAKRNSRDRASKNPRKSSANKRSESELQTQLQRLQALHEIETAVVSSLDFRSVLNIAVEKIRSLLPHSSGFIRLLNADTGLLEPVSWWNLEMDQWNKQSWVKGGLGTAAFESEGPLFIRNVLKDPRTKHRDLALKQGMTSYLGIPLVAKGQKLGVISFNTKVEHEYTGEETDFLATLAGQVAMAIYNSRLFSEVTGLAAKLAMINEKLEQAEKKYRDIFENSVEGIFQSTPDGRFLTANPALAHILGYESPEELIATVTDIPRQLYIEPERRREFQRQIEKFGLLRGFEARIYRKDKSPIWVSINARAVPDESGKLLYYEGAVEDITERKWAKEELQRYARGLVNVSRRLLQAQETERQNLSRELHDEIGQALTALKINMQANLQAAGSSAAPGPVASRIMDNIAIVDRLLEQARGLALDLRPAILDNLGLIPALRWYVDRHAQKTGLKACFASDTADASVAPAIKIACFRIVQEALTNVIRHAQAKQVWVQLSQLDGRLDVRISDDGVGFDVEAAREKLAHGEGLGLMGMEERTRFVGGQIEIKSDPTKGTEIYVSLPLEPEAGG